MVEISLRTTDEASVIAPESGLALLLILPLKGAWNSLPFILESSFSTCTDDTGSGQCFAAF